jgi:hypothetical protein
MQKNSVIRQALWVSALMFCHNIAHAEGQSNLELVKILVEKGVISVEEGKKLLEVSPAVTPAPNTVRVPYIPQSVKDDIGNQVREGVKEDVTAAVMTQAKKEGWGLPGAQPEWLSRLVFSGDFRLRAQEDMFASENSRIEDFQILNEKGSYAKAGEKAFFNTTEDRTRLRTRVRLSLDAVVSENVKVKTRLATGNQLDPVSTNQTLGNYGEKSAFTLDQGYIVWQLLDNHMQLSGGRMANPFLTTDLVWDADLAFDGVATQWNFGEMGATGIQPHILAGVFPIQELEISPEDKWLYGLEAGLNIKQRNNNSLRLALTYYSYDNIVGVKNSLNSNLTDFTAPKNMQRGNSLYNIRNSDNPATADVLYGLAADYKNVGLTLMYDIASFAPKHLWVVADYTNNIGYDEGEVFARNELANYDKQTTGYKLEVGFGIPKVQQAGDWSASFAYRHLERDAVLDAFADSDFLQGGTDNKGFIISGEYGVRKNLSVKLNYLSAASISTVSPTDNRTPLEYNSDVIQFDLNARF